MRRLLLVAALLLGLTACEPLGEDGRLTVTECQLDGGRWEPCQTPKRYENLSPGPHRAVVCAYYLYDDGRRSEKGCDDWEWVVLP